MKWFSVPTEIQWIVFGILGFLIIATVWIILLGKFRKKNYKELRQRVKTWWFLVTIFFLVILISKTAAICLFAFVSFLAFKEYLSLIPTRRADRRVLLWAYLAIPLQYYWVYSEWYGMFIIFIPVYVLLLLPMRMIMIGETEGFLKAVGTIHWGLMVTVFSISHIAYLLVLPPVGNACGGIGMVIFLIIATQLNDVFQFIWGKMFGKNKVVPKVSPNKTWEGLLGGVATTICLSFILGPVITPLNQSQSVFAGLVIGFSGFFGDVVISALKRDLGIKDSGTMLPGHGGILDRFDSLTYTAPVFFHLVYYLKY